MNSRGDALLLNALAQAPRRYRLPPLPTSAAEALAAGPEAALAFAMESARVAVGAGATPDPILERVFTGALEALIARAASDTSGDPSFRAQVLRSGDVLVQEYMGLQARLPQDRRQVRGLVDAIAHPGKMRHKADTPEGRRLSGLHTFAHEARWECLREHVLQARNEGHFVPQLDALLSSDAMARLERADRLAREPNVQRFVALREASGPAGGSEAALAEGRDAARIGLAAEVATNAALDRISAKLNDLQDGFSYAALHSLRPPAAFPGDPAKAKDEWDGAVVRKRGADNDLLLVVEVKATPSAAITDFSRMLRGLQRLAQARADTNYLFRTSTGVVSVAGHSLQKLEPLSHRLPSRAIYCSTEVEEHSLPILSTATKAVLLAQPACLAYAHAAAAGRAQSELLRSVWTDLLTAPRLSSALHQFEAATLVRDAMVHPDDLGSSFDELNASAATFQHSHTG